MKNPFSTALTMGLFLVGTKSIAQNNLLDDSTWTVGTGSAPGFVKYGAINENIRELDTDPFGNQSIIWKGTPLTPDSSGGWFSDNFPIDHTKTYRFTVWMKKENAFTGSEVFGTEVYDVNGNDTARTLQGGDSSNPIFEGGDVPQLNKWYLYVGFVHHSGYSGTTSLGGVYDPTNGNKILNANDFKFSPSSVTAKHRAYYYQGVNSSDVLSFFAPTVYEVNGLEPSVQQLLDGPNTNADSQAPNAPNLSSTGQTDTTADLSWSGAMDNIGVTGYRIYKDNVLETTLGNVSIYQVGGLSASTAYQFKIRALDAAGNESSDSNIVSVTTDSSSGGGGSTGSGSVWSETGSVTSYSGNVAVGRISVPSSYKLAVEGKICIREVRVDQENWPDYVFD